MSFDRGIKSGRYVASEGEDFACHEKGEFIRWRRKRVSRVVGPPPLGGSFTLARKPCRRKTYSNDASGTREENGACQHSQSPKPTCPVRPRGRGFFSNPFRQQRGHQTNAPRLVRQVHRFRLVPFSPGMMNGAASSKCGIIAACEEAEDAPGHSNRAHTAAMCFAGAERSASKSA